MRITSNPNDPEFRKALRELGAPDWYPQDAARHLVTGSSEYDEDGNCLSKLVCPICGWEKHIVSGDAGSMITINEGDKWAIHSGSTAPETFQIPGLEANPVHDQAEHQSSSDDTDLGFEDEYLKPFEDFLRKIE